MHLEKRLDEGLDDAEKGRWIVLEDCCLNEQKRRRERGGWMGGMKKKKNEKDEKEDSPQSCCWTLFDLDHRHCHYQNGGADFDVK